MRISRKAFAFVLGVVLAFAVTEQAAKADIIYTYTGNPMGLEDNAGYVCGGSPPCTMTGSFTVATPLGNNFGAATSPNTLFSNVTPESFSFTDGNQTITTDPMYFGVTTDASGDISTWFIIVGNSNDGGAEIAVENIGGNGDGDESIAPSPSYAAYNRDPGSWTETSVSSAPEPSTTVLVSLGGAFLLLAMKRKHRIRLAIHLQRG